MAAQAGRSMAGLSLAWLLADDRVTQIVVGPGRPEHLAPVGEALENPLGGSERASLEELFG
jgi:aryl-alcohol dehydrogenase-like predicted oxidoreductase